VNVSGVSTARTTLAQSPDDPDGQTCECDHNEEITQDTGSEAFNAKLVKKCDC
jgi:hypothetical protein